MKIDNLLFTVSFSSNNSSLCYQKYPEHLDLAAELAVSSLQVFLLSLFVLFLKLFVFLTYALQIEMLVIIHVRCILLFCVLIGDETSHQPQKQPQQLPSPKELLGLMDFLFFILCPHWRRNIPSTTKTTPTTTLS